MEDQIRFLAYTATQLAACLKLFDANCPAFFALNERDDYALFLSRSEQHYRLCMHGNDPVAAFGVLDEGKQGRCRLNWILVDPLFHGKGVGRAIMAEAMAVAMGMNAAIIDIAASDKSARFFARFRSI